MWWGGFFGAWMIVVSMNAEAGEVYATSTECDRVEHQADPRAEVEHKPSDDVHVQPQWESASERDKRNAVQVDLYSSLQDRLDPRKYNFPSGNETRFPVAGVTVNRNGVFHAETIADGFSDATATDAKGCATKAEVK